MARVVSALGIDELSNNLKSWVEGNCPDAGVRFCSHLPQYSEAPTGSTKNEPACQVLICFHSISKEILDYASTKNPDTSVVAYFIHVIGGDPLIVQRTYGAIYFAFEQSREFFIANAPGAPRYAAESQPIQPLPSGTMTVTSRLVRKQKLSQQRIVEHPLGVQMRMMGTLQGTLKSQSGIPIPNATIDARSLNKRTVTDANGHFLISGTPEGKPISLHVSAREQAIELSVEAGQPADIVIIMPTEEEHA